MCHGPGLGSFLKTYNPYWKRDSLRAEYGSGMEVVWVAGGPWKTSRRIQELKTPDQPWLAFV